MQAGGLLVARPDHVWQPWFAILGLEGPSVATKIIMDGLGGSVASGDHLVHGNSQFTEGA